ncbi:hypothetical protein MFFC18_13380 [Mariniblastus fucicola]|uniref:Uncharacterized protein n=1 Tax=Mariniblastus fucicola TaxID=980251 RepID=A0A5B9P989_9BACT|nr:hypothetical protein MFFC18_13380 [Mariniblastus fucicola]
MHSFSLGRYCNKSNSCLRNCSRESLPLSLWEIICRFRYIKPGSEILLLRFSKPPLPFSKHQTRITKHQTRITKHPTPITKHRMRITKHRTRITKHPTPITKHRMRITKHPTRITKHQTSHIASPKPRLDRMCGLRRGASPTTSGRKPLPRPKNARTNRYRRGFDAGGDRARRPAQSAIGERFNRWPRHGVNVRSVRKPGYLSKSRLRGPYCLRILFNGAVR